MNEKDSITKFLSILPINSKIALFSTTKLSVYLYKYIKEYRQDISVSFFVDSFNNGFLEQVQIITPKELKDNIENIDYVILASYSNQKKLEKICNELNVKNYIKINKTIYNIINSFIVDDIRPICEKIEFVPAGHYYSVIPSREDIALGLEKIKGDNYQIEAVDLNLEKQLENLEFFRENVNIIKLPPEKQKDKLYYSNNDWFRQNAGFVLASMILKNKPKKIIEIGSGFSTSLICDINKDFFNSSIKITCIEPEPQRLKQVMGRRLEEITLYSEQVQKIDLKLFSQLEENDLLFIDSSHVAKINSDVLRNFYEILPKLNKGVLVHFHDIPNNFEYYENWLEEGRYWNEAYFLRAFLQYNLTFKIEFFNDYMSNYLKKNNIDFPCSVGGGSIYLRKVE